MASKTFSGGDKLEAKLKELSRKLGKAGSVSVGFLEGSSYPDGTPTAAVAAFNEFGDPAQNRPPRPFFRRTIHEKSDQWAHSIGKIAQAAGYDANLTLERMGELIKGDLQGSINTFVDPPLAQSTIDKKGFAKPLIDTGHMVNSVDYEVK